MTGERRRRGSGALLVALVAIALGAAGYFFFSSHAPAPAGPGQTAREGGVRGPGGFGQMAPAVTLARVEFEPIQQSLNAIGTGRALQSLTLNAEISGIIEEIMISPGQTVETGAPIIRLEDEQQEIALAKARADYAIAQTNAQRFQGLVDDNAASELENESAQNELTSTNAELRRAQFELAQRTLRAPFSGVVGLTDLDVGDFMIVGARITTIDDVSALLVDFVIPESASGYVREGLPVSATAAAASGKIFEGTIRAVDSRIDPASRTRRVEAVLANEDLALIPGATFSIQLDIPGRQAAVAPGLAVQWDRAGSFVWKRSLNGVAERTPVVILQRTAQSVLLDAPLSAGDYIVAEGADLVRAGMPLPAPADVRAGATPSTNGSAAND